MWLNRPAAAVACYERALAAARGIAELYINKGTALVALNRHEDALESFAGMRGVNGGNQIGNAYRCSFAGLQRVDHVLLEILAMMRHWRLYPIASTSTSIAAAVAATVPGVALVLGDSEPLPQVDFHCLLLSLPLAFQPSSRPMPANIPYLRAPDERLSNWRGRMPSNGRLRVGICWAGSASHLNDRNRSIALDRFATLLSVPGLDFVSVQKEISAPQAEFLRALGVVQLGQEFTDLADTAAVLAMLDLLISVDTSVAHLAGAMGKTVALLLPFAPDFRWLLDRTDSPWYPTMRLYRQPAIGDWETPLHRLRQELAAVASRPAKPL